MRLSNGVIGSDTSDINWRNFSIWILSACAFHCCARPSKYACTPFSVANCDRVDPPMLRIFWSISGGTFARTLPGFCAGNVRWNGLIWLGGRCRIKSASPSKMWWANSKDAKICSK